ncbi:putative CCR4-associated factor 1 homolog 8 [Prunus yedoensis var. nudiflora]|uniref:poly(A)-specific ribonuclease n=1 Tax=Prunus yedoensis var. nudiflora TaxID=2094558 RepID=A0A314UEV1_PRUYE|nr:putative CCR4-associated factor 1 homolog 8 [Prunus yedoensis var. nudiflora]
MKIRGVWAHNFHQELSQFDHCLHRFPVISFDTEFPGFLRDTPRDALEDQRYEDVKFNVESLKLLQLGFTLSDARGNIGELGNSTCLGSMNGLDFARLGQFGISVAEFVFGFLRVLRIHRGLHDLTWVCFHGLYDLAYLLKLLTQKPLPDSVVMFAKALGVVFGIIYDVKFMARYCKGFFGGEIGLARVAKLLDVQRSGEAHQAGSDSLLTAAVFSKMNATFRSVAGMSQGCLYGISPTIVRYWQPAPVILRRPCFPVAAPHVYGARLIHSPILPTYVHM